MTTEQYKQYVELLSTIDSYAHRIFNYIMQNCPCIVTTIFNSQGRNGPIEKIGYSRARMTEHNLNITYYNYNVNLRLPLFDYQIPTKYLFDEQKWQDYLQIQEANAKIEYNRISEQRAKFEYEQYLKLKEKFEK